MDGSLGVGIGRHLPSWDPPATKQMFVNSAHSSVSNSFAIHGLEALAEMASAAGKSANASVYQKQAAGIKRAFLDKLGDPSAMHFCDGPCADPRVQNHSGVTTNYFTAYHGLVPEVWAANVWKELADFGLVSIGDYGSFMYLNALSMHVGDDGTAMLTALTKCDAWSWCREITEFNATM